MENINRLSEREAMQLPSYYIPSALEGYIAKYWDKLKTKSISELVVIINSVNIKFPERYVAGQMLSYMGDPRIIALNPIMIDIPTSNAKIGLDKTKINSLFEQFKSLGVKRDWLLKEVPQFNIKIAAYRLARYPVTNQEFKEFLIDTLYPELPSTWVFGIYPIHLANHPVYGISINAINAYIEWLNTKTLRHFRLPTEIEWEFAAAGNNAKQFPWGNHFAADCANTLEAEIFTTTPVGIFPKGRSDFGIDDLAGNVEEYVSDTYWVYPGGELVKDDLYQYDPNYQMTRGGSFARFQDLARCSRRHGYYPKAIYACGFRLAEDY